MHVKHLNVLCFENQDINDLDALFEEEDDNMMIDMMAEEENTNPQVLIIDISTKHSRTIPQLTFCSFIRL